MFKLVRKYTHVSSYFHCILRHVSVCLLHWFSHGSQLPEFVALRQSPVRSIALFMTITPLSNMYHILKIWWQFNMWLACLNKHPCHGSNSKRLDIVTFAPSAQHFWIDKCKSHTRASQNMQRDKLNALLACLTNSTYNSAIVFFIQKLWT